MSAKPQWRPPLPKALEELAPNECNVAGCYSPSDDKPVTVELFPKGVIMTKLKLCTQHTKDVKKGLVVVVPTYWCRARKHAPAKPKPQEKS